MTQMRSRKLHQEITARVSREIVSGSLEAGAHLPSEPELIATYGVSKTVIRETVQALAAFGLVRVQHGKRSVVLPESEWDILSPLIQDAYRVERLARPLVHELYDVRLVLEPQAARWMAERRSSVHCKDLQSLIAVMKESVDAPRDAAAKFLDHDREFHMAIATAAENRVLRAIVRDVQELLRTSWQLTQLTKDDFAVVFMQHAAIADAIIDSDASRAEHAMREHLEWAAAKDLTEERESSDSPL